MTLTILPVFSLKLFKQFCPSSIIPGGTVPTPSDNWLPVVDTVIVLPTAPPVVTAPETIPGNSAPVDGCFDPDNVDYSQIFNNLLPQEDVEGTYDESLDTDVLIQGKNELIPIRGVTRLVFGLITSRYDLTPKFTDVAISLKTPAIIYNLRGELTADTAAYLVTGEATVFSRLRSLLAATGTLVLTGYSSDLTVPLVPLRTLSAGTGSFDVNKELDVLLLSHFDSTFDEVTGNTVGYNWYSLYKPTIGTGGVFGSNCLVIDAFWECLYTYLNPVVITQDIPYWTLDCWVYVSTATTYTIPFNITADGQADDTSFYVVVAHNSGTIQVDLTINNSSYVNFEVFTALASAPVSDQWYFFTWEASPDGYRLYWDGQVLSDTNTSATTVPLTLPQYNINNPVNVKSAILLGNSSKYAGTSGSTWIGRIDEVRLLEGAAYGGINFTPPTAAFTDTSVGRLDTLLSKLVGISASTGSFTLTGNAAGLTTPTTALSAGVGNYSWTGQAAVLLRPSVAIAANTGTYTASGQNTIDIPTYIGQSAGSNSTGDVYVSWPGGHAVGDLGIIVAESSSINVDSRPITPPYGWSLLSNWPTDDTGSYCSVFYKIATTTTEPSVFMPRTGNHQLIQLSVFRGTDTENPFVTTVSSTNSTSTNSITYPSVTGVIPRTRLVEFTTNPRDSSTAESATSRANAHPAWADAGAIRTINISSGDGGGVSTYHATVRWQVGSGLPSTTATATQTSTRNLGTLVLRPKDWYGDIGP